MATKVDKYASAVTKVGGMLGHDVPGMPGVGEISPRRYSVIYMHHPVYFLSDCL